MQVWQFIHQKLSAGQRAVLLWVVQSEGSSPGRNGFKLAVAGDNSICGTIGGGMMEHKLVEKAKVIITAKENAVSLVWQYHNKQHTKNQSGMVCSGNQLIAFVPLSEKDIPDIKKIISAATDRTAFVSLTLSGIALSKREKQGLRYNTDQDWQYAEAVDQRPVIHIIGGGHVGLALSELMAFLQFYVTVYDNREGLNTMEANCFAHEKKVVNYETIAADIPSNREAYVVIATFGYRDDKIVFKQLLAKDFFYMGMMGSDSKTEILLKELANEGIDPQSWKHCFVPIGLSIFSKTAQEIAVSIAAQIILHKNKALPTGRRNSSNEN